MVSRTRIHLIAAARPNFMKVAPLYHALASERQFEPRIVHTGQHYDANMSDAFFTDLRMPDPHVHLGVGGGSHAMQTGGVMQAYERVALEERPDQVIVVGDVNSTLACALVAAKLSVPVIHLEAGLRSGDRSMPEEINRVATDAVSDVLWTPSHDACINLGAEGIPQERIDFVGNIMIDSYETLRPIIEANSTRRDWGLETRDYAVVTLHRPSNVDDARRLELLIRNLLRVSNQVRMAFPVHPRTRKRLEEFGLLEKLTNAPNVMLASPLGYVPFMNLVTGAKLVVTDSGGIQEETTYLGVPCLTLRENTERPITVTHGTNRLVTPEQLEQAVEQALGDPLRPAAIPLWDGRTAERCVASLKRRFGDQGVLGKTAGSGSDARKAGAESEAPRLAQGAA